MHRILMIQTIIKIIKVNIKILECSKDDKLQALIITIEEKKVNNLQDYKDKIKIIIPLTTIIKDLRLKTLVGLKLEAEK